MTTAERAYRLALRAYPAEYRRERGLEILTTILDGEDRSWTPRGRELVAIVLDGIERRGRLAGGGSHGGSVRAGVRLAAFAWLLPLAVANTAWALSPYVDGTGFLGGLRPSATIFLLVVSLAPLVALALSWWWGPLTVATAALGVSALGFPSSATWPWELPHPLRAWAVLALVFVPGLACALARPRHGEPPDRRSLWWIALVAGMGVVIAAQDLFFTSWIGRPMAVALVGGVLLARRDPRLAVGVAGVTLLALADRLAEPQAGVAPVWLGAGALLTPLLAVLVLASLWQLRPVADRRS